MARDAGAARGRPLADPAGGSGAAAADEPRLLTAQELLAGSQLTHDVEVPVEVLRPGARAGSPDASVPGAPGGRVVLRPLRIASLALIARASQDDVSLVPLLMIKDALVEPALQLEQIRQLHAGLVHFLVARINQISGLGGDGADARDAASSSWGHTHVLLARHFGWTPQQVAELTPGQVAVYLSGLERVLALDASARSAQER